MNKDIKYALWVPVKKEINKKIIRTFKTYKDERIGDRRWTFNVVKDAKGLQVSLNLTLNLWKLVGSF